MYANKINYIHVFLFSCSPYHSLSLSLSLSLYLCVPVGVKLIHRSGMGLREMKLQENGESYVMLISYMHCILHLI